MQNRKVLRATILSAMLGLFGAAASQMIPLGEQQAALQGMLAEQPRALTAPDPDTGKLGRVYGSIPMEATSPMASAIQFVNRYSEAFGVRASDLVLDRYTSIGDKFEVFWFHQRAFGVKVDQAGLTVLVRSGSPHSVVLAGPIIRSTPYSPPNGLISHLYALQIVRKLMPHADNILEPEFTIWSEGSVARYAYKIEASTNNLEVPERWIFFIDAVTGDVLEQRDGIYYVDINGSMKGWATPGMEPDANYNPPTLQNLPGQALVQGGNSAWAGMDGLFTIPHPGSTQVTVEARLRGQWTRVENQAGSNEILTMNVTPPGPADFIFNSTPAEFVTSQLNALIHTEMVHNFAKSINPAYPGIDIQMPANVNINNQCNAFYNGSSINFFRAGGSCVNTAYTSVVYHEYGHHIVATGHNNPSGAFHEGFADITSMLLADDPIIGRGFSGPGTRVRDPLGANVQYPCSGGSHHCGQVVGGAFWRLNVLLQAKHGAQAGIDHARYLYLNVILMSPPINPNLTIDVLTLDDDDGDITNGTPNYDEIDEAFSAHNLPAPPLSSITGVDIAPATIIAGATSTGTVHLRSAAPAGGAEISLQSSNPGSVQVPGKLIVPSGATTANFQITSSAGAAPGTVEIFATRFTDTKSATIQIVEPTVTGISVDPLQVTGGNQAILTVQINGGAPDGGLDVNLWSNNSAAIVPPTITINGGEDSGSIVVATTPVVVTQDAFLFAQIGSSSVQSTRLIVATPVASSVSVNPNAVSGGNSSTGTVSISGPAPTGGALVYLSTGNSAASVPPTVVVPEGQTSATFNIQTISVHTHAIVPIRASRWTTVATPLTVLPASVSSFTITPSSVKGGKNATGRIVLDSPAPQGFQVQVTSSSTLVTVPVSVTFTAGSTQATFTIKTKKVNQNTTVPITVTSNFVPTTAYLVLLK